MARKPSGRRFIFVDRKLTIHEAMIKRAADLSRLRAEIDALSASPLDTMASQQVEVQPDDPRYEDAPIEEVWISVGRWDNNGKRVDEKQE